MNYYNEFEQQAAAWLRELIANNLIPAGDVDERSIEDVRPTDLHGYTQCHFFAGIGGWAYALDLAGWPRDRPVWTGSCPCQPFSAAGKGAGFEDERHLWPSWQHLIAQCRPPVVFGEQVASKAADAWIDLVHADMEGMGYAFGCVAFPAASVGSPHIRDRNYWMADDQSERRNWGQDSARKGWRLGTKASGETCGVAYANGGNACTEREQCSGEQRQQPQDGLVSRLADAHGRQCDGLAVFQWTECYGQDSRRTQGSGGTASCGELGRPGPVNGHWRDADWLGCTDGKWRPVEPGTFPLAHGIPARVVRLRGYGNAIVPQQAAEFVRAYLESRDSVAVAA